MENLNRLKNEFDGIFDDLRKIKVQHYNKLYGKLKEILGSEEITTSLSSQTVETYIKRLEAFRDSDVTNLKELKEEIFCKINAEKRELLNDKKRSDLQKLNKFGPDNQYNSK